MHIPRFLPLFACLLSAPGHAQTVSSSADAESDWSYSAALYFYALPDDDNYVQPAFSADRGTLHLEARYNYEDLNTSSIWAGYNMSVGETVQIGFTPMLGAVFGNTRGVAPGYRLSVDWKQLEFYTEGEYVFSYDGREDSYFYSWSELAIAPLDWLRAGIVAQRTRAYQTERDVQPGLLLGVAVNSFMLTAYAFNPDKDDSVYVISIGIDF